MYTSIVLVALAGATAPAAVPESLEFKSDYVTARKLGSRERKPLAVFIGSGPKGWEQRTKEGQLSQDAQDLLKAHYVCVYLDTSSEDGKRLSRDFGMAEGLVLSDAAGENQAFRHEGKLENGDLERQLKKFSDPARVAVRTETLGGEGRRSYYPAEAAYAPAPGYYYPPPAFSSIPSSGSCSSCSGGFRR
jgi:hypothetical protein